MNAELPAQPSVPTPPKDGSEGQGTDTNGHAHGGEANPAKKVRRPKANGDATTVTAFGGKLVRLRALSATGGQIRNGGARWAGLGRLMISAEAAEQAIAKLDHAVQRLMDQNQPGAPRKIVALMQVRLGFNRILLESGIAMIRAARVDPLAAAQ